MHDPLHITGAVKKDYQSILTPDALMFVTKLVERFSVRREALLARRAQRQQQIDAGTLPDFRLDTKSIRDAKWTVAAIPENLQDRRVEITGPAERKMIINALNSGARVFMADIEDSLSPTWERVMDAQVNLRDHAEGKLSYVSPEGKRYQPNKKTAVLIVRPRGWHLEEKHVLCNGTPAAAALIDFGLYFFHNAHTLFTKGAGPYFYLPKLESYEEAQLWADIFNFSERAFSLPKGTIKATVLIETILAAFEMEEILYALKDYCVGLNCGRWDYIFSFIKKFHRHGEFVLPDRAQVTMLAHCLRSYSLLLIQTCHKRGAFAMGGMSAYIPVKGDEEANTKALAMVRADKEREAGDGHDGTWVAHPALVPVAMEVFDRLMPANNQLDRKRGDVQITARDLLAVPGGAITEAGLRNNISVGVQYIASWLAGSGCVPIFNLMEDAATAEIARSQIWQWIHHKRGVLADGRKVTLMLYKQLLDEELHKIQAQYGDALPYRAAADLLTELVTEETFAEFLTLPGYRQLD